MILMAMKLRVSGGRIPHRPKPQGYAANFALPPAMPRETWDVSSTPKLLSQYRRSVRIGHEGYPIAAEGGEVVSETRAASPATST